ncbi:DUF2877 domain-containing protein [Oryzobacter telluris]|uniref:oxamate carbamoyltransferase subunit AllH family protein n=1 Tax=Oryzobacter telluris TaxID=3149179 RepID=UPI00370DA1CC
MPSSVPRAALPAAASTLSAGVLWAGARQAVVLGSHRLGLYLDVDGTVLPVVPSDAVALPTALRLGARSTSLPATDLPWGLEAGDRVLVGGGRVVLPVGEVVVVRTWRPARVRRVAPGAACRGDRAVVDALLAEAASVCDPWLAPAVSAVLTPTTGRECGNGGGGSHFRTHGEEVGAGVAGLIGRGRGLTPSGDDALAGALLVAHALRVSRPLATAVRSRLHATTAVSGALLGAAGDGFAARPVVALVDAAVVGHVEATARTLPEVVAIGHTSGRDLVTGVLAALRALGPATVGPTLSTTSSPTQTPTGRSAA